MLSQRGAVGLSTLVSSSEASDSDENGRNESLLKMMIGLSETTDKVAELGSMALLASLISFEAMVSGFFLVSEALSRIGSGIFHFLGVRRLICQSGDNMTNAG